MTNYAWPESISKELEQAQKARSRGNEGMARVCARRAAGVAISVYLEHNHLPDPGPSVVDRLNYLKTLPGITPAFRKSIEHLTQRVNEDFELSPDIDLISEAKTLINYLLLNNHISKDKPMQTHLDYQFIQSIDEQISDIPSDSIISKTIINEENIKLIVFGFAPGQELSEHTAARPAILHFLRGEASLTLGDQPQSAQPGTWAYLQPHLPHSILAKTEVEMILVLL